MSLLDRLRPRWRDADPQERRAAVKHLDDLAVLRELASDDPDAAVRDAAASRTRDVLVDQATANDDAAATALGQLQEETALADVAVRAPRPEVRATALARVVSERLLRDVVRASDDPVVREAALARIEDTALLRSIAVGDVPAEVALAALERITDPAVLASIAQHREAAKTVRSRARELVPPELLDAPPLRAGDVRARQHALCVELEGFADLWDCDGVAARVRSAADEWQRLAGDVPPMDDVAARFARAREAAELAVTTWERRRAEALHVDATHAAHVALVERVEALGADADPTALAAARREWDALEPLPEGERHALGRRFRQACDAHEARRKEQAAHESLVSDLEAIVAEVSALADADDPPSARAWKTVSGRWRARVPEDDANEAISALRARFDAAAETIRRRRKDAARTRERSRSQNLARLTQLMERLDAIATAETFSLRAARRDLKVAEAALEDPGPLPPDEDRATWKARLEVGHALLVRRIGESEEAERWRQFANATVQEDLIARVEALLASGDLAAASKQLGEIQREWERAATAPRERSEELWNRYRTVRNQLRRRVDAWQAENAKRKQALCDAVAPLADSADWKETADEIKRLQAEWKEIGPVPPKLAGSLWRRFREPCDRFFARRGEHFGKVDAEREENAKRKLALCEQAEALADSKDWETTANALKRLQAKWKEIGPAPRRDNDALWRRFRGACDRFFDRRGRQDELEREEQVEAATAACAELETAAGAAGGDAGPAPDEIGRLLDAAWTALHALDDEPGADTKKLAARFGTACARLGETCPAALAGTRVDPEATRGRREKICARLEELIEVALERPRPLTLEEQALQLKARLAAKTIGGAADPAEQRRQDAAKEIARLRAQWARLGPPLGADAAAAAARFDDACARFDSARHRTSD